MQRQLENCCDTKRLRWAFWIDEHIWKILVSECCSERLEEVHSTVRDHCRTAKPRWRRGPCHERNHLTSRRTDSCAASKLDVSDKERRVSVVSAGLWCTMFQSDFNHNLFFICISCLWEVADGFSSTAASRDVKTKNSMKSLYLSFPLLWDETNKRKRHWKSFVVVEDKRSSLQCIISKRNVVTKEA